MFQGKDIHNGSEELPYAKRPLDYYTETKILQEKVKIQLAKCLSTILKTQNEEGNKMKCISLLLQLVLGSNGDDLYTVAIRPHSIYGPRDPHMVPTTVRMAKAGRTKYIIGWVEFYDFHIC